MHRYAYSLLAIFLSLFSITQVDAAAIYATHIVVSAPPESGNIPENILGAPDGMTANFQGVQGTPGYCVVSFGGYRAIDGNGADIRIHLFGDWEYDEGFSIYASNDAMNFVLVGDSPTPPYTTPHEARTFDFDLANSGLTTATYIRLTNATEYSDRFEGPDLDAFELLHAIPEPTTAILLLAGTISVIARRR